MTRLVALVLLMVFQGVVGMAAPVEQRRGPRPTESVFLEGAGDSTKKKDAELIKVMEGLRALLKMEPVGDKRDSLLLADAAAALALSRSMRLNQAPRHAKKAKELEARYSKIALNDASEVLKGKPTLGSRSRALYYSGLALSNLNDFAGAQKKYQEALVLHPQAEYAPAMALLTAEASFDGEKYTEAIQQYRRFFHRFSDSQKAIAIYKTAWSYINLKKLDLAEKSFLLLVGKKWAGAFAEDCIKDLAYVMTQHRAEADVIEFAARNFVGRTALRLDVLTATYKSFQGQSRTRKYPVLYAEIMRLETDPAKKLSLAIANLKGQQRDYASAEPYREFRDLRARMNEARIEASSPQFDKISAELEPEIQTLIASYGSTFTGKTKTPESMPKSEMARRLVDLLGFHVEYFPTSADRATSYGLMLEVCDATKDTDCVYKTGHRILADGGMSKMHRQARLALLALLDASKEKRHRDELIVQLQAFHRDHVGDPQWVALTKRLSALHNEDKNFAASIPLLEKLAELENTSEARYRLLWALFESGRHEEVVAKAVANKNDKFGKDSKSLVREAHLRLASQKAEAGDFGAYEAHVKGYLSLDPEPEKGDVVFRDYLVRSLERKQVDRVHASIMKLPAKKRFGGSYRTVASRLLDAHLKTGRFQQANELVGAALEKGADAERSMDWFQARLGSNRPLNRTELKQLSSASPQLSSYVVGVLTLAQPMRAVDHLRSLKTLTLAERKLFLLALQASAERWDPLIEKRDLKKLGDVAPADLRENEITKTEKSVAAIKFPAAAVSAEKATALLQKIAESTRKTRTGVARDLKDRLPPAQTRILAVVAALEDRVARSILDSPMPKGLSEADATEYRRGIESLAKEFSDQAEEYRKLSKAVEDKLIETDEEKKRLLAPIDLQHLPSVRPDIEPYLQTLVAAGNPTGALVALDRWKNLGEVAVKDYYTLRARVLLSISSSRFMKEYVYGELKAADQASIVAQWRISQ